ncbi:nitrite reductase small subunit NirD [Streptomyces aidingensis]|uniref:Nitrite reductase (NADH) small subunit n=1 Tax=Streptomyces aidingensis TaxID=910347 RepID=A0A1I1FS93_9ACTN|nr:nitrite reductase small subunit NirD [Streptomyces aidingensis]SFC02175.1 nitrite reductase (NADH) small subunit [Streptomyces aidingensis]
MTTATQLAAQSAAPQSRNDDPAAAPEGGVVQVEYADGGWVTVCRRSDLLPGRGVAVLLPEGRQAAVFLTRAGEIHVIGNRDPFTGAYVLSRGLLGSAGGAPFVASPLLKQRFSLTDGRCLDDPEQSVPVHPCRVV